MIEACWRVMTLFDADPFDSDPPAAKANTGPQGVQREPTIVAPLEKISTRSSQRRQVYTDGACQGNPGPGGWGWVMPGEFWASGAENPSTNQRMELAAVLHAVTHLDGALEIVSDSTYVVNCFRDEWWKGWERRGWRNSQKKEVANQDLWKPLIAAYKVGDVTFRWVKGHAGNEWNEVADELAVTAAAGNGSSGEVRSS